MIIWEQLLAPVFQLVEETAGVSEFSGLKLAAADTGWTLRRKKKKLLTQWKFYICWSSWYEFSYIDV
jgi:hypothetical protein